MFKDIVNQLDLSLLWSLGLVMMFTIFVLILLYAVTRSRRQIDRWARIPLTVEDQALPLARREENCHD